MFKWGVTRLPSWTERNGDVTTLLPRRVADFAPATRDAIFLVATAGLANLGALGEVVSTANEKLLIKFEKDSASAEVSACLHKAYFVGRWLATSGTTATVMTVLGVKI